MLLKCFIPSGNNYRSTGDFGKKRKMLVFWPLVEKNCPFVESYDQKVLLSVLWFHCRKVLNGSITGSCRYTKLVNTNNFNAL